MSVAAIHERGDAHEHAMRWLAAAALTVLAHAAALWIVLHWRSAEVAAPSEPPPAVMIDLSPIVAASAPQQDVAVGPQMTEAEPALSDEAARKTVLAAAPDPGPQAPLDAPMVEPAPPPLASTNPAPEPPPAPRAMARAAERNPPPASPAPPSVPSAPDLSAPAVEDLPLPPAPTLDAEAAPPPPPIELQAPRPPSSAAAPSEPAPAPPPIIPKTERPAAAPARPAPAHEAKPSVAPPPKAPLLDKRRMKAESRRVERRKATKPNERSEANRTSAPAASNAPAARASASPASSSGATASAALATWKGALVAHINRFKRFPPNAVSGGTVSVAFTINRAGSVVSARLIARSGDRALDEEAVALLHRASPVPPPPPQFGGSVVTLTVPIRFDR